MSALADKFLFSRRNYQSQHWQIFDCYGLRDSLLSARRQRNRSASDCLPYCFLGKIAGY
ncbi:MAG: hypothetical protein LBU34_03395 [Planctomycetaceae bacterium]|nr:hypothetical protein [Planctomycetaceae bacterium]